MNQKFYLPIFILMVWSTLGLVLFKQAARWLKLLFRVGPRLPELVDGWSAAVGGALAPLVDGWSTTKTWISSGK